MRGRVLMVVALAAGCGEEAQTLAARAVGTWSYEGADGCTYGLVLDEDGTAESSQVCQLEGGGLGVQSYVGPYDISGDRLYWSAELGTCDEQRASFSFALRVEGDALTLTGQSGVEVYERVEGGLVGGSAAFGCFDAQGGFVPRAISPL